MKAEEAFIECNKHRAASILLTHSEAIKLIKGACAAGFRYVKTIRKPDSKCMGNLIRDGYDVYGECEKADPYIYVISW